jgi:hypothetical protein
MRSSHVFSKAAKTAVAATFVVSSLVSGMTAASATTAAPTTGYDTKIISSGSDTTYDMMKGLGKLYSGANGCATIFADTAKQPKDGSCDTADLATGNGDDKTKFAWVNDGHAVPVDLYPVGSGAGANELCGQGQNGVRQVNFSRASSNKATVCSDSYAVAFAKDAVSWWHATKDASGNPTASAKISTITKAILKDIYAGNIIQWSELNNNAGVLDKDGNQLTDLPASFIDVYDVQQGSGTREFWHATFLGGTKTDLNLGSLTAQKLSDAGFVGSTADYKAAHSLSTGQENQASSIFVDGKESTAIYYMSLGRYKQAAGITGTDNYSGNSTGVVGATDSMGKINGVAPTDATVLDSTFVGQRYVYNILRYPSAATLAYAGPKGFLCSVAIGAIKDRISGKTYHSLITKTISDEGFTNLPAGTTGGTLDNAGLSSSYCRVTDGTGAGAATTTGPTVAVKSGATFTGLASATFEYSTPVRSFDASKITVTNNEGTVLDASAYTVTSYNQKSVLVPGNDAGTVDSDPYQVTAIKSIKIALNSTTDGTVSYAIAAGSAKNLAGISASAGSSAAATDSAVPTVTAAAGATFTGFASATFNYSKPVRSFDASKIVVTNSEGSVLDASAYTITCFSQSGSAVASCNAGTASTDPTQASAIKSFNVALNSAITGAVSFTVQAASAKSIAGVNASAGSASTSPDAVAPTVTVAAGATFTGLASASFNYSKPVRSFDASKIVVTNSEGNVLPASAYTVACYKQGAVVVAGCADAANDTLQTGAIVSFNVALKSSIPAAVSFDVRAGSAKSLAGVNASAGSASTTADSVAPVATVVRHSHSGMASITYKFGEPVRIDASKFSAQGSVATVDSKGALASVASGAQAVELTYIDASGDEIDYSDATPAADKLQTQVASRVIVTVKDDANSVIFTAAAGAATDLSGNSSAAVTTKYSALADLGAGVSKAGTWSGNTEAGAKNAKTYTVKGSSISISLTGTANIFIDGVQVYNANSVVHNAAVDATKTKPAKPAYDSYTSAGKNFTAGTYSLGANTAISAGGTATTRTNPDALSTNAAWNGSGYHTVKVVVVTGPVAVTALSAS